MTKYCKKYNKKMLDYTYTVTLKKSSSSNSKLLLWVRIVIALAHTKKPIMSQTFGITATASYT